MTEQIHADYQVVDGHGPTWVFPYARLEDITPTVTNPAAVLSRIVGTQICGVIVGVHAGDAVVTIDLSAGKITRQSTRNVLTYAQAAEATWGVINIGDPLYYDRSATMPVGTYLSTSPLDAAAAANPLFGHVTSWDEITDMPAFPKAAITAVTLDLAVIQRGVGV